MQILIFILGLITGISIMSILQINKIKEDLNMYKLAPIEEIKQKFYRKVEEDE